MRGIHVVGRAGLAYDLLVQQAQWQAALELAPAMPDVRFVLDHAGKPRRSRRVTFTSGRGGWAGWRLATT
jgi:L-fuconolactonase